MVQLQLLVDKLSLPVDDIYAGQIQLPLDSVKLHNAHFVCAIYSRYICNYLAKTVCCRRASQ